LSSILKALKKLESDIPAQNEFKPWPQKINTREVISKHAKKSRGLGKLLYVLVAAMVLAGGGWLFLGWKPLLMEKFFTSEISLKTKKVTAGKTSFVKRTTPGAGEQVLLKTKNPAPQQPTDSQKKQAVDDFFPKKASLQSSDENFQTNKNPVKISSVPPAKLPQLSGPGVSIKSASPEHTGRLPKRILAEPDIINSEQTVSKGRNTIKAGRPAPLKKIENSGLKIQAIAWFKDSQKRIAVINGRILREGENINGYCVVRIGQEDVIVRQGEEEFKLIFR
jgi:hypothetical protein